MNKKRWCHACGKVEEFGDGWFEMWIDRDGSCRIKPVEDAGMYHMQFRSDIFACGQGSALVLVERYLQSGGFDAPAVDLSQVKLANTQVN